MKEWELLKRFSSSQTARMDSWYIICRYHNKNAIPGIRTIKTIENGIYRFHCRFRVECSDSLLELTYIRDRFLTFIHALILIILAGISCIGIFSFTLPGFLGGLCGLAVCVLLIFLQKQLKKQAFSNMDKYIQTFILSEKSWLTFQWLILPFMHAADALMYLYSPPLPCSHTRSFCRLRAASPAKS